VAVRCEKVSKSKSASPFWTEGEVDSYVGEAMIRFTTPCTLCSLCFITEENWKLMTRARSRTQHANTRKALGFRDYFLSLFFHLRSLTSDRIDRCYNGFARLALSALIVEICSNRIIKRKITIGNEQHDAQIQAPAACWSDIYGRKLIE